MITLLLALAATPELEPPPVVVLAGFDAALYRPAVDRGLTGATPYADVFGKGRGPLLGGHAGAAIGLGSTFTFTAVAAVTTFGAGAHAFVDDGGDGLPSTGSKRSGGKTSLDVTPLSLLLGLRYTGLWNHARVPLIPYAELGPTCAIWSVDRGDGETVAEGATAGLSLGAGLILELTRFDQRSAKALSDDFGVTSVALRAGVLHLWIDGFGARDAFVLSDTAWSAGLELGF